MTTWLQHVKQVHASGSTSFKDSLKRASASWKKTKGKAASKSEKAEPQAEKPKRKRRRKKKAAADEEKTSTAAPEEAAPKKKTPKEEGYAARTRRCLQECRQSQPVKLINIFSYCRKHLRYASLRRWRRRRVTPYARVRPRSVCTVLVDLVRLRLR